MEQEITIVLKYILYNIFKKNTESFEVMDDVYRFAYKCYDYGETNNMVIIQLSKVTVEEKFILGNLIEYIESLNNIDSLKYK